MKTSSVTAQQNVLVRAGSKIRFFLIGCLSVLTLLATEATATELLTNRSFDEADGAGWGAVTNTQFATPGAAYLHPISGFMGTVLWQNLDVADVGSATGTASIAMTTVPTPPGGNTISVYLEYTVAGGTTNRLLLLNPYNVTIVSNMPNSSVFSTAYTLPAEAQRIVRFSVEKAGYGSFYAQEFSLDIVLAGGGVQDLGLSIANMSEDAIVAAPFVLRAGVANLTANVSSLAFYANDILIGQGVLAPYGEWEFSDGSHLSVMSNDGIEMLDYTPPHPSIPYMFMIGGVRTSLDNFNGTFTCFIDTNEITGPVSASSSLTAGQLSASLSGDSPLGNRTLVNGTCLSDTISYGLFWNPPANGNYAITARAIYNSGLVTTAAVVNISVTGVVATPIPTLAITSPTAGQRIATPSSAFTVTGTAADDVAVSAVYRKVNNSAWQLATGTSPWSSAVTLVAGANTIRAYCVDASGNSSATSSVTCTLVIDSVKPTVAITSPTPTPVQRITAASPDVTVRGTARDIGAGVVAVRCQLNYGEWRQATGTNVWSCPVTLNAGTNTVMAYSMDAAGNCSLTQKVSCIYVVATPIGISKTGNGTVGVYTNGQPLEIGKAYTLTATPAAGFKLQNWTTNGSVAGTALSFGFIMRQNLTVCANFIDTVKPTIAITSPTPMAIQRITVASPGFTVRGTASDIGAGVVAVRCQLNYGEWQQATGTNAWSCPVALNVGMNTLMAYSMDAAGNCSLTQKVSCICAVTTPIGISKTGNGTVGVYTNGQLLESGKSYTLTATPGPGFSFVNWTSNSIPDVTVFNNENILTVQNQPTSPTVFTLATATTIASIRTYHWNYGSGKTPLGTIRLSDANGTVYGPWSVVGSLGQGGVFNAYWTANPNILLQPGTYTVIDSDPATWAQNSASSGKGFVLMMAAGRKDVLATTASYTFTMSSGLAVCANFIDIGKPTVAITSPTPVQRITVASPDFTVRGTAGDIGAGVVAVRCQLNYGEWLQATGANVWSCPVTLSAGTNTVMAYSMDAAGNCSLTQKVSCTYVVTRPIGISKTGLGTVGVYTNGQLLEIGKPYTLTATPAAGFVLKNWTTNGSVAGTALSFGFSMRSGLAVCANFISKTNLNGLTGVGLDALSEFVNTNGVTRGQAELLEIAAANFDLVARNNPNNYTNRIYNALTIMLNLINDPVVRRQTAAFGLNLDNLFDPTCVFPAVMPSVNLTVDNLAVSLLPAVDKAYAELNAVPATWRGMIEISPDQFPIDEAVWIDIGDVTAMKAALKGLRAFVGLLKAYNLNVDYRSLYDPIVTPQVQILVDGSDADWTNVTSSLSSVYLADNSLMATQEVAVALDGNQIALLMKGCPFVPEDTFQIYCTLRLSNGTGLNSNRIFTVEMSSDSQVFGAKYNGQQFDNFEMALVNGVLEVKFPIPDMQETSQVTIETVEGMWSSEMEFPGDVPIKTIRASQPEFLSKVRNTTSLAAAKPDVLAALTGYLAADTLIANRIGVNAQLSHLIDFDASNPDAVKDRLNKKFAVETIRASLSGAVQVEGEFDIEGTATRPVYLGAFFNAPYITTNIFPTGLRGTFNNPVYTAFPDPTFRGILPGMTSTKLDKYLLGYTYASVNTQTSYQNGESFFELHFGVDTERKFMVITNVTVSGPGISLTALTLLGDEFGGDWYESVLVGSKPPVGSQHTFNVYFADGSREVVYSKIKAWMAFSSVPTVSGSMLRWPAVAGVDRYEVRVGNTTVIRPPNITSLDLTPYGYTPGHVPYIWIEAVDHDWNRAGSTAKVLN